MLAILPSFTFSIAKRIILVYSFMKRVILKNALLLFFVWECRSMNKKKMLFSKFLSTVLAVLMLVSTMSAVALATDDENAENSPMVSVNFTNIGENAEEKAFPFTYESASGNLRISYPTINASDLNREGFVFSGWKFEGTEYGNTFTIDDPKEGKTYTARAVYEKEGQATTTYNLHFREFVDTTADPTADPNSGTKVYPSINISLDDEKAKKYTLPMVAGYVIVNRTSDGSNASDYKINLKEAKASEINVYYKPVEDATKRATYEVRYYFNGNEDVSLRVYGEGKDGDSIHPTNFFLEDSQVPAGFEEPKGKWKSIYLTAGTHEIINIHYSNRNSDADVLLTITHNRYNGEGELKSTKQTTDLLSAGATVTAADYILTSSQLINYFGWYAGYYTGTADKETLMITADGTNEITINYQWSNKANYPYTVKYLYKMDGNWIEIPGTTKTVTENHFTILTEYPKYISGYTLTSGGPFTNQNVSKNNVIEFKYNIEDVAKGVVNVYMPDDSMASTFDFKCPAGIAMNAENYVDFTAAQYVGHEIDTAKTSQFAPLTGEGNVFNIYLKLAQSTDPDPNTNINTGSGGNNNSGNTNGAAYYPSAVAATDEGTEAPVATPAPTPAPAPAPAPVDPATPETETIEEDPTPTGDSPESETITDNQLPTSSFDNQEQGNSSIMWAVIVAVLAIGGVIIALVAKRKKNVEQQ